jgi:hypothetical protein
MDTQPPGTPVTQEFILRIIGWIVGLAVAALIGYGIYRWTSSQDERYRKQSEFNAQPINPH